ncbi:PREDICTED: zinc finger protein 214-like [Diuraphis noxia]|uniref:zinc finger protein 214-like n=1 Tax=Diuraphis noxia TaxID=143948 RepID=UPI00076394BF|nr:PREDICTED: zinc finger protein 214-like [Diuraphis noxia]XP_015365842.1 PREDICTED: zinc finger protein 214-like [Diuraphis noxia]
MSSALEEREEQSLKCFICNIKVTTCSSYKVYCTFMPQRNTLLIDIMSKILKKDLQPSQMKNSVLCRRCFTLFDELDQISTRFTKLQSDIIKRYTSTCSEYKNNTDFNVDHAKIVDLSQGEQKKNDKSLNAENENSEKSSIALNEIVENIISSIQTDETMDDNENSKDCASDTAENKIALIDKKVTEHMDVVDIPCMVENPICETKLRENSVARVDINYKCENYNDSFQQASDVKNHFITVHQSPECFFCTSCDKSFSTKQALNNHLTKEHNTLDKGEINDPVDLISTKIKIEDETSQCDTDSIIMTRDNDFINEPPENVIIDVKPEFPIDNNMYLEEIVQEENEDDDFEWKEDEKINIIEENFHEDSSSAIDETVAPSSGSEKSDKRLKKRQNKKGGSRSGERACLPAIHSCALCGKKWRTVTELKSHIQSHSSLRPYVCEICGQAYKMKKALDVHIGMHNGIHPFTCEYCNKSFTQKVGLQKHIPIHTGYTRFQCDLCGKRFIHQKSFHIHTMTHTGEKHVKCSECGLAVLSQSHLKRHLRVHTGERPYACPICGKRFAEKYNMNAHVHIHDNSGGLGPKRNRNHICQLCGMSYDRKHKLEYHLASAHNKIDTKLSQNQELVQLQQPKIEYFQENSQNHQIINVDNNSINRNGSTAMITVSGVKLPISLDDTPIMVATMPQPPHATSLVQRNIPAEGSLLTYSPSNTNDNNEQPLVDNSQKCCNYTTVLR